MRLLDSRATDGEEPCHVAVHASGRALIVSNYASGTLLALPVHENGVPAEGGRVLPLQGQGPTRGRQDSAHPHQALFAPGGGLVLVPDLGADLLRSFTFDPSTASLTPADSSALPPGTGPRHAVSLDTGLVVITGELSQTVVAGRLDGSTGRVGRWSAVPSTARDLTSANYPGDVLAHPDAPVVYVANRGADTLAVFRVEGDEVLFVEEVAAGVRWPQHLAFVDDEVLVAGRDSSLVVALQVTRPDGRLGASRPVARVPGPTWLAPEQGRSTTRVAPSRR
jgi:6-phosphogluconolactonase (cycloisomerase 2 family)